MTRHMTDVIVVGGGLIGLLSAYFLHESGAHVTLLEKNKVGKEASWAGGGILSPLYPWQYPDAVNDLATYSQGHYAHFCEGLYQRTDDDPEWIQSGLLLTEALDSTHSTAINKWKKQYPQPIETLSNQSLKHIEPALHTDCNTATWFPDIAQIRNPKLLTALLADLTAKGVTVIENCPFNSLLQKKHQITGVSAGQQNYYADQVVIACGAWSGQLVLQSDITVKPVLGQMIMYKTEPSRLRRIVLHHGKYIIPRKDGHILCGSTLEWKGFNKITTDESKAMLQRFAATQIPFLADLEPIKHWSGLRPGSPNSVPYIGEHQRIKGLYFNTGHYRYGVTMGLGSAELLRDIMLQRPSFLATSQYALDTMRKPTDEFVMH